MQAVELIKMDLDLLEPESENKVPFGVRFRVNQEADEKYRAAFGEKWDALMNTYEKSILLSNRFFIEELTKLCQGASDGPKEAEKTKRS